MGICKSPGDRIQRLTHRPVILRTTWHCSNTSIILKVNGVARQMAGPVKLKGSRLVYWMLTGACSLVIFQPIPQRGQSPQEQPRKPNSGTPQKQPKSNADSATENAPDQPMWDPLRAEKDIEVGRYYLRKGDLDAAIDRFQDAIVAKPGSAIPFRYLGEAQERKKLKKQALRSYRRYLDLAPHADDAQKIRKKIEKLQEEVDKEKK